MGSSRLAVLIDADNSQVDILEPLLMEVSAYGETSVRRIYGDFTLPTNTRWKDVLNEYAIRPVQQFAYTSGKNSTDTMLIIDAMDLLYTRLFDGFCLVSSDSDFTSLALRIREEGLMVIGCGEKKTPLAFRNACQKFYFVEDFRVQKPAIKPQPQSLKPVSKPVVQKPSQPALAKSAVQQTLPLPQDIFLQALALAANETGWASLSALGSQIRQLLPGFDVRHYGYKQLGLLVKAHQQIFLVENRSSAKNKGKETFLRARNNNS